MLTKLFAVAQTILATSNRVPMADEAGRMVKRLRILAESATDVGLRKRALSVIGFLESNDSKPVILVEK